MHLVRLFLVLLLLTNAFAHYPLQRVILKYSVLPWPAPYVRCPTQELPVCMQIMASFTWEFVGLDVSDPGLFLPTGA